MPLVIIRSNSKDVFSSQPNYLNLLHITRLYISVYAKNHKIILYGQKSRKSYISMKTFSDIWEKSKIGLSVQLLFDTTHRHLIFGRS